ncbi:MAG: SdrD B-like domain-containing protein, partial [Saprospiraceae bacterium]
MKNRLNIEHTKSDLMKSLYNILSFSFFFTFMLNSHQLIAQTCGGTEVGGTVYQEYKFNGDADGKVFDGSVETRPEEKGVPGVAVTVYDDNGAVIGMTTSDSNGDWTIDAAGSGPKVRVEYTLPTDFESGPNGGNNGSSVMFTALGLCDNDLTVVFMGNDHCEDNPQIAVVKQVRNSSSNDPTVTLDTDFNTGDSFVPQSTTDASWKWVVPNTNIPLSASDQVGNSSVMGSSYGIDWSPLHMKLFTGTYYKSWAKNTTNGSSNGLGEAMIFASDYDDNGTGAAPQAWLDLETLLGDGVAGDAFNDQPHPGPLTFARAGGMPNVVGFTGLGSIQTSPAGDELYVVNLATNEVYIIPINADGSAPTDPADIIKVQLPDAPGCGGQTASLGLGVHPSTGEVYASTTCTGSSTADVKGYVYKFDPKAATPSPALETTIPLGTMDYPSTNPNVQKWYKTKVKPWESVPAYANKFYPNNSKDAQYMMPWLGDIEFNLNDNNVYDMNLGVRNRYHDMINSSFYVAGGPILKVPNTGSNTAPSYPATTIGLAGSAVNWTYSPSTRAGSNTSSETQFYQSVGKEGTYGEGSLAGASNFNEIVLPAMDNVSNVGTSGLSWLDAMDGTRSRDSRLIGNYQISGYKANEFTKANNWGGITILCELAPLEIGNRVWADINKDGVQDPNEAPLAGVTVKLYDKDGNVIASTVTDSLGQYYFSTRDIPSTTSQAHGLDIIPDSTYLIKVTDLGPNSEYTLPGITVPGQAGNNDGMTLNDNDANVIDGFPTIELMAPQYGEANHTYDFGFIPCPIKPIITGVNTLCEGDILSLMSMSVEGNNLTYSWSGPNGFTSSDQNITINPITSAQAGIYTVTITGDECAGIASDTVVVPSVDLLAEAFYGCPGDKLDLNANLSGEPADVSGVCPITAPEPDLEGATYLWSGPNGFSSTEKNPNVSMAFGDPEAGFYEVTISYLGCTFLDSVEVISPASGFSISANEPCVGEVLELTAPAGGDAYDWSGPNGFTSSEQNPVVDPAMPGTYTLIMSSGDCGGTASVTVGIKSTPSITSIPAISCEGSAIMMSAMGGSGALTWEGPDGFTGSGASISIPNADYTKSGTYTVMSANGCMAKQEINISCGILGMVSDAEILSASENIVMCDAGGANPVAGKDTASAFIELAGCIPPVLDATVTSATANSNISVADDAMITINGPTTITHLGQSKGGSEYTGPDYAAAEAITTPVSYTFSNPAGLKDTVHLRLFEGTCCCFLDTFLVIYKTPEVIAQAEINCCPENTIDLEAIGTEGSMYVWSGPNGYISNLQDPPPFPAGAAEEGQYTVTVTNGTATNSHTIDVALPAGYDAMVSGISNSVVNIGDNAYFSAEGGQSYLWIAPSGDTVSMEFNYIIPNAQTADAGTYQVVVMGAVCCQVLDVVLDVQIVPACINGTIDTIEVKFCAGDNVILEGTSGFDNYLWILPNGGSSTMQIYNVGDPADFGKDQVYLLEVSDNAPNTCKSTIPYKVLPPDFVDLPNAVDTVTLPCGVETFDLTTLSDTLTHVYPNSTFHWYTDGFGENEITNLTVSPVNTYFIGETTQEGCTGFPKEVVIDTTEICTFDLAIQKKRTSTA